MRDKRFVAKHRSGPLSTDEHRLMALWAADCAEHVLRIIYRIAAVQPAFEAIRQARAWAKGEVSVGNARKAAIAAHRAARDSDDAAITAAIRAAGHAAATVHMADHCLSAAGYAIRAAELGGINAEAERLWQDQHLPTSIRELVLSARAKRQVLP